MTQSTHRGSVIRFPTPFVSADDLLIAALQARSGPQPTLGDALRTAEIALCETLDVLLDGFPYRREPTHPRAIHARMVASALVALAYFPIGRDAQSVQTPSHQPRHPGAAPAAEHIPSTHKTEADNDS